MDAPTAAMTVDAATEVRRTFLELGQRPTCLMRQIRPLLTYDVPMLEQLLIRQIFGRLEVGVQLPLLVRVELHHHRSGQRASGRHRRQHGDSHRRAN